MTASYRTPRLSIVALLALGAPLAACSNDVGGGGDSAFLTIEGSRSVVLPYDGTSRLAVRYHDEDDQPLAGRIDFEVVGNAGGSTLSSTSANADGDGIVEIQIRGAAADVSFKVRASAPEATPVEWTINVNQQGTMDLTGSYGLSSRFDVVSGMPGQVGEIVNIFIDMTDDPYDPATFLIDLVADDVGGIIEDVLNATRPALDGMINDLILDNAPQVVDRLLEVGDQFGQASRRLGIETTLVVSKNAAAWKGTHKITGYGFQIDEEIYSYSPQEIGAAVVEIKNVGVTLQADKLTIAEHTMPLRYGALLGLALEEVIIPEIDPNASSVSGLLDNAIDCYDIGYRMFQEIGYGSPDLYEGACELAITAAGNFVMDKLRDIDEDAAVSFIMTGNAKVKDENGDLKADAVVGGKWTGNIDYAGSRVAMPADSTFVGARM